MLKHVIDIMDLNSIHTRGAEWMGGVFRCLFPFSLILCLVKYTRLDCFCSKYSMPLSTTLMGEYIFYSADVRLATWLSLACELSVNMMQEEVKTDLRLSLLSCTSAVSHEKMPWELLAQERQEAFKAGRNSMCFR